METESELFDAKFLGRLRTLFFKLRKRRQLQKQGSQSTPAAGFTREFKDHRRYSPGDDYRSIDWRLFARLEKPFVRVFEEVQEYHVHILVDRSRSMAAPYGEKRTTALQAAMALAYLALVSQHRVSVLTIGEGLRRETRPLKGQGHVRTLLDQFAALEFGGETDLVGGLHQFRPGRDRRGLVFLVSDLFGRAPEVATEALAKAAQWPAETHVIQVLHPQEIHPNLQGEIRLVDVENGHSRRIWMTHRELERYDKVFQDFLAGIQQCCLHRKINYFTWTTDQPFEDTFVSLLSRGNALAGTG